MAEIASAIDARTITIDCFPSSAAKYRRDHVVVAVDVIRATTMVVTALALGRRCLIARDVREAFSLQASLPDALLAGEVGGDMPLGFHMNNSPAALADRTDNDRPLIMLSSSGTALLAELADATTPAYVASFRNSSATVRALAGSTIPIALIGAGSRDEFRDEDQLGCAWVAEGLVQRGWVTANDETASIVKRWSGKPATAAADSDSVGYLRRSGQVADFDFIVDHVDDLDLVCRVVGREVRIDDA